jgi:hypothetical protein
VTVEGALVVAVVPAGTSTAATLGPRRQQVACRLAISEHCDRCTM